MVKYCKLQIIFGSYWFKYMACLVLMPWKITFAGLEACPSLLLVLSFTAGSAR